MKLIKTTTERVLNQLKLSKQQQTQLEKVLQKELSEFAQELLRNPREENRLALIAQMETLHEVRLAEKRAHSKKSASKSPEKKAKYQLEIDAAQKQKNMILQRLDQEEDFIQALVDMGEDASKILHNWIREEEAKLADQLQKIKMTNKKKRSIIAEQESKTPECIKEELKGYNPELIRLYEERVARDDQGVIAINRKRRLLQSI